VCADLLLALKERETKLTSAVRSEVAENRTPRLAAERRELAAAAAIKLVQKSLEDSKAEAIVPIDITGKSPIADWMVVASGRSQRHVGAIAERLVGDLKAGGGSGIRVSGERQCDWVLIDAGDVIVHIFRPEVRTFYSLEKMWLADHPTDPVLV
jgi:ribosome-associated protein